ncbi:hypothetical protein [Streptomyces subrutilus]|uniref:DUF998 domain-containing protein n=1 Tax=Streptomyces subrutilus TaxID=36818 RepID=A0A1E5PZZ0_9ACTN|nr:hypothetical protein [Streptomyces subrutilus]OEJ35184.1 hypothetical protein BGK67_31195 [Streptomyces subrutilus]
MPPLWRRLGPIVGLLLLSPICAEYLIGYLEVMGRPVDLLIGLLVLAPLYGTAAVMIREVIRRTGRGWPSILLLSAAFGVIQAGLVDQSLFNPDFVDEPSWDSERLPTVIPALGISVNHVLDFGAGHVIWSFAAPIAVIDSCAPRVADRPWLGRVGMGVMVVLYGLAVLVIFREHTRDFMASPTQLGAAAAAAVALAAAALLVPHRRAVRRSGWVPAPWLAGSIAMVLMTVHHLLPASRPGTALDLLTLVLLGGLVVRWSGQAPWGRGHALAVGGAALAANAGLSFMVEPLGEVSYTTKYAANAVLVLGVLALLFWARRRLLKAVPAQGRPEPRVGTEGRGSVSQQVTG